MSREYLKAFLKPHRVAMPFSFFIPILQSIQMTNPYKYSTAKAPSKPKLFATDACSVSVKLSASIREKYCFSMLVCQTNCVIVRVTGTALQQPQ